MAETTDEDRAFKEWSARLGEALLKNLAHNFEHADEIEEADAARYAYIEPADIEGDELPEELIDE